MDVTGWKTMQPGASSIIVGWRTGW